MPGNPGALFHRSTSGPRRREWPVRDLRSQRAKTNAPGLPHRAHFRTPASRFDTRGVRAFLPVAPEASEAKATDRGPATGEALDEQTFARPGPAPDPARDPIVESPSALAARVHPAPPTR